MWGRVLCPPEAANHIFTTITQIGLTTVLLTHGGGDEIGKASHGMFQNRPDATAAARPIAIASRRRKTSHRD